MLKGEIYVVSVWQDTYPNSPMIIETVCFCNTLVTGLRRAVLSRICRGRRSFGKTEMLIMVTISLMGPGQTTKRPFQRFLQYIKLILKSKEFF